MRGISVVVAVRDEMEMLPGCLARLAFADEVVVVVDDRTQDHSARIAAGAGARVLIEPFRDFAQFKNVALAACTRSHVLVVDADERVTSALATELRGYVDGTVTPLAVALPVRNFFYGREIRFGGWSEERPVRLLPRGRASYAGVVHEHVVLHDDVRTIVARNPIVHFSHRSVVHNLRKSAVYIDLAPAGVEQESTLPTRRSMGRRAVGELVRRLIVRQGWRDGTPGFVDAVYQAFAAFCIEARRWEVAQRPRIEDRYLQLEAETE